MKIIGIDLGTNSLGWAVVEKSRNENFNLIEKGVRIFQEGVKLEKGSEISRAAERTRYRSARRLIFRRKIRKINVIRILSKNGFCPFLPEEALKTWRNKGLYPYDKDFLEWQKTRMDGNRNPYYYRALAVEKQLDIQKKEDRYILGRAFYHMAQRRGFRSNRLDQSKESQSIVKEQIDEISKAKGDMTLGQYFYGFYQKGEKIRGQYTDREKHYLEEFNAICDFQKLPKEFVDPLRKAIFFQRPLKSQKGLVGKCPFEKNKNRCPASHPLYEEFRMYQFINNIKIKTPLDEHLRFLTNDEKKTILPLFYRKKPHFKFEDIAKKLVPKGYHYEKLNRFEVQDGFYLFNYDLNTTVSGNNTLAQLTGVFGENWLEEVKKRYLLKENKTDFEILNDIWHVLFSFDKQDKLKAFALQRLQVDEETAEKFSKIHLNSEYTSLSLKAIRKILPFLKQGLHFSHAVFLAKLEDILPGDVWQNTESRFVIEKEIKSIIDNQNFEKKKFEMLNGIIKMYRDAHARWSENEHWLNNLKKDIQKSLIKFYGIENWKNFDDRKRWQEEEEAFNVIKKQMQKPVISFLTVKRVDERIKDFLRVHFDVAEENLKKLYHPSAIEVYKPAEKDVKHRVFQLGSPIIPAIKNPMAMRALHQLRKVLNELLRNQIIDRQTVVNIEMSRELNNANERRALKRWQKERENMRNEYREQLRKDYKAATGKDIIPTERDVLKYQLWEEQQHICLYTGKTIAVSDFIGGQPRFDIEHTIPRSLTLDNAQSNLTLCDVDFNRKIKKNKIPSQLFNYDEILQRIEPWKEKMHEARLRMEKAKWRAAQNRENKEAKDRAIEERHYFYQIYSYWKRKYGNFVRKEIPAGFKSSQLIDTGIMTKYTRLYLKSLFGSVYTVKGQVVSDFRKMWGIQPVYQKKERVSHIHHCIDAVTMACLSKSMYEQVAKAYHTWENSERIQLADMPDFQPPWPTFAEDMNKLEDEVLVSHYTPDVLPKQSKKKLRKRGRIVRNKQGKPVYLQGDTVRGALHLETNYGAIKRMETNKKGEKEEKVIYVRRIALDELKDSDIKNIVDDRIRSIVEKGKKEETRLRKEMDILKKKLRDTENLVEKETLEATMSQLEDEIQRQYAIPNKDGSYTPIKKVRYKVNSVKEPLKIKKHRDASKHIHKHYSLFVNAGNYMTLLYEGDMKGKLKRDYLIINNLNAGKYYTLQRKENGKPNITLVPAVHPKSGFPLNGILKKGTLVLFWENSIHELKQLEKDALSKRLYKIIKLDKNGQVTFKHHMEARNDKVLKEMYEKEHGVKPPDFLIKGVSYVDFDEPFSKLRLSLKNFNFIIEQKDFILTPAGEIIFLK